MAHSNVYCRCGSTHCMCDDGCICSPPNCPCLPCKCLKAQYFDKCAGELLTPLDNFPVTGRIRQELDKMHEEIPQCYKKCSAASDDPPKHEADDDLIFQMDDIDDPPKKPEHELASSNVTSSGHSGSLQPCPNINCPNHRQSQTREGPRIYTCDCVARSRGGRMLRELELQTETLQGTPCIFDAAAFHSNESRVTEAPTAEIVLANSELNNTVIISTLEDSKVTEDLRSSELNPSINIPKPEASKSTETPITQDRPKSSELNPGKISNPGELQITDVSGEELSPTNMYSSETLPSDLSSGDDDDDSQSSHSSVTKSPPIKIISTSAPALFDVPYPFRELESPPKQETSDIQSPSEESNNSNLPRIETLLISDSQSTDKKIPLELGLSIETISTDVEANVDDLPPLYFTVSPSVLTSTKTEVESSESKAAAIPCPGGNFLKIPSPEFSQHDSKKASSESSSSIETLPTEPSIEQFTDEPHKSTSPKKDN